MDQPSANAASVGAKCPLILDGQTFLVDSVSPFHFGCFWKWLKAKSKGTDGSGLFAFSSDPAFKALPPELQAIAVREAMAAAKPKPKSISPEDRADTIRAEMTEVDGCAYFVWLLARDNHAGLTHEFLIKIVDKLTPEYVLYLLKKSGAMDALEAGEEATTRGN